jgi:hypothetical protein
MKFLFILFVAALATQATYAGGNLGPGCVASIVQDDAGSQVGINQPGVQLGAGKGTTAQLAEAFLVTSTQVVSEVQLKLDVLTPALTQLDSDISVQIVPDNAAGTTGIVSVPTLPSGTPVTSGNISAIGSINASEVAAATSPSETNPRFYDFCFFGANCSTAGAGSSTAGVTLNAGQVYWIIVTTTAPGTGSSYVEWRGTNTAAPGFSGYVFLNGQSWLPINGVDTSNFNFDFKLGC